MQTGLTGDYGAVKSYWDKDGEREQDLPRILQGCGQGAEEDSSEWSRRGALQL